MIVPDFGGFLLTYKSARFNSEGDELLPPARVLSFNRSLINNDGLLASELSAAKQISYSDAMAEIANQVNSWKEALSSQREVRIDNIGVISANSEGKWQFQSASNQNFLGSSFGLDNIIIHLNEAPEIKGLLKDKYDGAYARKVKLSLKSKSLAIAASVVLMMGISGILFNNYFNPIPGRAGFSAYFEKESLPVSISETPKPMVPNTPAPNIEQAPTETATAPIKENAVNEVPKAVEENTNDIEIVNTPAPVKAKHIVAKHELTSGFYIIGGCFTVPSNATRFLQTLKNKGYQAELLNTKDGLFRVSYQMDSDSLQADAALKAIRSEGNEAAWLLHLN